MKESSSKCQYPIRHQKTKEAQINQFPHSNADSVWIYTEFISSVERHNERIHKHEKPYNLESVVKTTNKTHIYVSETNRIHCYVLVPPRQISSMSHQQIYIYIYMLRHFFVSSELYWSRELLGLAIETIKRC